MNEFHLCLNLNLSRRCRSTSKHTFITFIDHTAQSWLFPAIRIVDVGSKSFSVSRELSKINWSKLFIQLPRCALSWVGKHYQFLGLKKFLFALLVFLEILHKNSKKDWVGSGVGRFLKCNLSALFTWFCHMQTSKQILQRFFNLLPDWRIV